MSGIFMGTGAVHMDINLVFGRRESTCRVFIYVRVCGHYTVRLGAGILSDFLKGNGRRRREEENEALQTERALP